MIYYTVESKFWRRKIGNKLDNLINGIDFTDAFVNMNQEFHHSSPIEARKSAFNYYQSIIDVLYDGLDRNYTNDYQARIDLQYYLNSNNEVELGNTTKFKITDDFLNGIEVFMNVENSQDKNYFNGAIKLCIHGIRYVDYHETLDEDLIENLKHLIVEYQYYKENRFSTENTEILKHFNAIGGGDEYLMQTPFDWDFLMEEFDGKDLFKL